MSRSELNGDRESVRHLTGYFIRNSLGALNRDCVWLARETEIPVKSIYNYCLGLYFPSVARFSKISRALEAPYNTVREMQNDSIFSNLSLDETRRV